MIVRADRAVGHRARRSGMVGTVLVHAAAVALLFTQVHVVEGEPAGVRGGALAAPGADADQASSAARGHSDASGREAGTGQASAAQADQGTAGPTPKPQPRDTNKEPPPKTAAPVTPLPGETPSTGTDVATIKTPGSRVSVP